MPLPVGQRHSRLRLGAALCLLWAGLPPGLAQDAADGLQMPETMKVVDDVVTPRRQHWVHVGIGEAKYMRFECLGGPADVGISLSTFAEHADPLLFVSLNPDERPSFRQHDANSFAQWREDSSGDHFVIARAVGPRGGWLGLHNAKHFAAEALQGIITVHCSYIVAFDTFFWDHLRSASICPTGGSQEGADGQLVPVRGFCSGHGSCGTHGVCECDEGHAGPACSHSITDHGVAAEGNYDFQVATNRYQYFRVRVPPQFRGGYLQVTVKSTRPLVVLLRSDGLPTKRNYKLSNFDDWMAQRSESVLQYKVDAPVGSAADGGPDAVKHRRLQSDARRRARPASEWMRGNFTSWGQLFRRARGVDPVSSLDSSTAARIRALADNAQTCPDMPKPAFSDPSCQSPTYKRCEGKCKTCVGCIQGSGDGGIGAGDEDEDGPVDRRCKAACNECVYSECQRAFASCAGSTSCSGPEVDTCEDKCASCMTCFSDRECDRCGCCLGCLPLAAKCGAVAKKAAQQNQFVFVGVFNHRRPGEQDGRMKGIADIKLVEDLDFDGQEFPSSWMAALYNPFHDIRSLEFTQTEDYPDGDQYIYSLTLAGQQKELNMQVQLYRDRVTLLHVNMSSSDPTSMRLEFKNGLKISHVLSTRQRAPRSFFDFDQVHVLDEQEVQIEADGRPAIWCAIFGAEDGSVEVLAQALDDRGGVWTPFTTVAAVLLLCAALAVRTLCKRTSFGQNCAARVDPGACGESVDCLVVERNPEDEFLHRGGTMGDDGI